MCPWFEDDGDLVFWRTQDELIDKDLVIRRHEPESFLPRYITESNVAVFRADAEKNSPNFVVLV